MDYECSLVKAARLGDSNRDSIQNSGAANTKIPMSLEIMEIQFVIFLMPTKFSSYIKTLSSKDSIKQDRLGKGFMLATWTFSSILR